MDAPNDAPSDATDASIPVPVTTETANCMPTSGPAEDCACAAGEVAISGGAFSGQLGNMLNASQAGPSYGGATQTWRVSCVTPTDAGTGVRVACVSPFAECLSGSSTSAVHVETANCVSISGTAYDCSCNSGEVAISGGAYSGQLGDMLNATQAGPSYGGSALTWRVSCVNPTGTRVNCAAPFVVCLGSPYNAAVRIETTNCTLISGIAYDCTCNSNEVAISGGAYSGQPGYMLNASQAGPSYGGSAQTWRVSCVNPSGTRVQCASPFAVCASSGI